MGFDGLQLVTVSLGRSTRVEDENRGGCRVIWIEWE